MLGYLPSAVEGTEEERSEEESQKTFASVLVATALVTQKGTGVSDIASKASLATARIAKPKSISTQSIDDGVSMAQSALILCHASARSSETLLIMFSSHFCSISQKAPLTKKNEAG